MGVLCFVDSSVGRCAAAVSFFSCFARVTRLWVRWSVVWVLVNAGRTYGLRRLLRCADAVGWCLTDFGCCERALVSLLGVQRHAQPPGSSQWPAAPSRTRRRMAARRRSPRPTGRPSSCWKSMAGRSPASRSSACRRSRAPQVRYAPHALRRRRGSDAPAAHGPPLLCNAARC